MQGGHMGSRVVASLFALKLGAGPMQIGLLIAAYSIFQLALALTVGRLSDRFGSRLPMLGGCIVFAFGLLLPVAWPTLTALYLSAPLIGIGFVFFNVANQNLAGTLGTPQERTRDFATLSLGYSSGHMIGPVLAGLAIDQVGYRMAYLMFAVLTLWPVLSLTLHRALGARGCGKENERGSAMELMRNLPLRRMIIVSGLVTTGWDLYVFYVPIYGHSIGLSASTIGTILGAFAAATFIVRVLLPVLTARLSVEYVLAGAMAIAALLFLPFTFVTYVPALLALSFCIGLTLGVSQPLTLNLTYNRSPAGRSGEVTGLRLTINNITHIAVPVAAGSVGALFGITPVFWASAAILGASGYMTVQDRKHSAES